MLNPAGTVRHSGTCLGSLEMPQVFARSSCRDCYAPYKLLRPIQGEASGRDVRGRGSGVQWIGEFLGLRREWDRLIEEYRKWGGFKH